MIRSLITLVEDQFKHAHVYHAATRHDANDLIEHGIDPSSSSSSYGDFGYGFYTSDTAEVAQSLLEPDSEEAIVVLEYLVEDDARILDMADEKDMMLWHGSGGADHLDNPKLYKVMIRHGIDGVKNGEGVCFYNKAALKFTRVYSGVVDDPIEETNTDQLDEFALGGLQRCTAVTVNALLKAYHLQPIQLSEVPVNDPGVLRILDQRGLAYRPSQQDVGRSVQQFATIHRMGTWYLLTPGHAMALINGELFDAENKGPDGRKLQAVYQISRR